MPALAPWRRRLWCALKVYQVSLASHQSGTFGDDCALSHPLQRQSHHHHLTTGHSSLQFLTSAASKRLVTQCACGAMQGQPVDSSPGVLRAEGVASAAVHHVADLRVLTDVSKAYEEEEHGSLQQVSDSAMTRLRRAHCGLALLSRVRSCRHCHVRALHARLSSCPPATWQLATCRRICDD